MNSLENVLGRRWYSTNKNAMAHLGNGSRLNRRQRSVSRRLHFMVPLTRDSSWKPQCTDGSNSTVRWFGCARDTNQVARAGPGAQDSTAPRYTPGQLWLPVTPRQASRQLIHPRSRVEQNVLGGCRENSVHFVSVRRSSLEWTEKNEKHRSHWGQTAKQEAKVPIATTSCGCRPSRRSWSAQFPRWNCPAGSQWWDLGTGTPEKRDHVRGEIFKWCQSDRGDGGYHDVWWDSPIVEI